MALRHVMGVLRGGHLEHLVRTLESSALDGRVKPGHGVGMMAERTSAEAHGLFAGIEDPEHGGHQAGDDQQETDDTE